MAKKKSTSPAKSGAETPSEDAATPSGDDALHQAFRAALERKNARHDSHPGTGPAHLGVSEAHNDRQRRQFRRKSG